MNKLSAAVKAFLSGALGVIGLATFLYFISLDLRWMMILAVLYYFLLGVFGPRDARLNVYLSLLLYVLSPAIFLYFILAEIPQLYLIIPLVALSVILGYWVKSARVDTLMRALMVLSLTGLTFFTYRAIPGIVQEELVHEVNEPTPDFSFQTLGGHQVTNANLKGQVVLLDFFGTWCKPCWQELIELNSLTPVYPSVPFYVISTGQGGDTVEKVEAFVRKTGHQFSFGFDEGRQMHRAFGFTGVPALVILDREGRIRLKHEGYNAAEDISSVIRRKLEELLRE